MLRLSGTWLALSQLLLSHAAVHRELMLPRRGSAEHLTMATGGARWAGAPKPSASQLAYQQREMGSLISFNMVNFWDKQLNPQRPFTLAPASAFTPMQLDADQWAEGLEAMGARYSLLLAKDESGFLLWPTKFKWQGKLYNYTTRESPLKGRDILMEYAEAAKKKGIGIGFYYLLWGNFHLNITRDDNHHGEPTVACNSGYDCSRENPEFEAAVLHQIEELWSNYGDLAEVWWDGGIDNCNAKFASAVNALKAKLIGNVSAFGGDGLSKVRWIGTESGHPACPPTGSAAGHADWHGGLWSSTPNVSNAPTCDCGTPDGVIWAPAEADTCIRTFAPSGPDTGSCGCWSWAPNTSDTTKSLSELSQVYLDTVGNNANMLLNMAPDSRGLVPDSDMKAYKALGTWVDESFGPGALIINSTCPPCPQLADDLLPTTLVWEPRGRAPTAVVMTEDLTNGQRVQGWKLEVKIGSSLDEANKFEPLANGTSIGHKHIVARGALSAQQMQRVAAAADASMRLTVTKVDARAAGPPNVLSFAIYSKVKPTLQLKLDDMVTISNKNPRRGTEGNIMDCRQDGTDAVACAPGALSPAACNSGRRGAMPTWTTLPQNFGSRATSPSAGRRGICGDTLNPARSQRSATS